MSKNLNELLTTGFIATGAQLRAFGFGIEGDGRHYVFQRRDVVFIGCGHYNDIPAPGGMRAVGTVITPPSTAVDITAETEAATPAPATSPRDALRPLVEALVEGLLASMMPAIQPAAAPVVETTVEPATEPAAELVAEPVVEAAAEPVVETTVEPATEPAAELVGGMTDNEATSMAIMITCMEALAASAGKDNVRRQRALAAVRKAFMETKNHDDALLGAAEALMRGSTKRWRAGRANAVDGFNDVVEVA